jgi:surfeit locus 1 family protein
MNLRAALAFKPAFWPTVFTVPAVLLMLGLGVWQLERLQWKEALISERAERTTATAIAVPASDADVANLEYRHLAGQGEFLHDKEIFLGARSMNGNPGYHLITPFKLDDGRIVLVDRGWIPLDRKTADKRAAGNVSAPATLDGVLRLNGKQTWFVPDNRPDLNFFFWVDLPAMAKLAALPNTETRFYVEAGPAANPGGFPIGGQTRINLPNDHLQYAITWFSLAIALSVIYVLFHRQKDKESKDKTTKDKSA